MVSFTTRLLADGTKYGGESCIMQLGPDASPVWPLAVLYKTYLGVREEVQCQQVLQLVARQGHYARSSLVSGTACEELELERSLAALTGLSVHLELKEIDSPALAATYAAVLDRPVTSLEYPGSAAWWSLLLFSARGHSEPAGQGGPAAVYRLPATAAHAAAAHLGSPPVPFQARECSATHQPHPHLSRLKVATLADSSVGEQDAISLRSLSLPSLGLILLQGDSLTALLRQLHRLQLAELQLFCMVCDLTVEQQELVAKLSITHRLVIQGRDPCKCLEQLLPGLTIEYVQVSESESRAET